jgi:hypothetical protein
MKKSEKKSRNLPTLSELALANVAGGAGKEFEGTSK